MELTRKNLKVAWFGLGLANHDGSAKDWDVRSYQGCNFYARYALDETVGKNSIFVFTDKASDLSKYQYWDYDGGGKEEADKVQFHEFEDGTMISTLLTENGGWSWSDRIGSYKNGNGAQKPFSKEVTFEGRQYTLGWLHAGTVDDSGEGQGNDAQDDFHKYIMSSSSAKSTWQTGATWVESAQVEPSSFQCARSLASSTFGNFAPRFYFSGSSGYKNSSPLLIMKPKYYVPIVTVTENQGLKNKAFTVPVNVAITNASTVTSVKAEIGGEIVWSAEGVPVGEVLVDFTEAWDGLAKGRNDVTFTAANAEGREAQATFYFEKIDSYLELQGNPVDYDERPERCTLISALILGEGAEAHFWVTNNGNDLAPVWEEYTGTEHVFTNQAKNSEKWGLAWKLEVGGANATTRSEVLKQIAMAVI